MDKLYSVLTSFPPASGAATTKRQFDDAAKTYVASLSKIPNSVKKGILEQPTNVLQLIDPAANSIGYLFVLEILLNSNENPTIERSALLDATASFLLTFDPIQIRYAGALLYNVLEVIGMGKLFPGPTTVELLASAILRIDPSGSLFTSTHLTLAKQAYETGCVEPALKVLDRDITLYPVITKDPKPLCLPDLPPTAFISTATGLTGPVKPLMIQEYDFISGLAYMSKRDWLKARKALERVVSYPTKDKGVSRLMTEAYKKWLLVGLLSDGEAPSFPPYTQGNSKATYNTIAGPYRNVASLFNTFTANSLKEEIEAGQSVWGADGNEGLIREVQAAYQKWQILNLRHIYQQVSITKIQESTASAATGQRIHDKQQVIALVRSMIESQILKGQIETGEDGEDFLTFHDAKEWSSEKDFAQEIARAHQNISALSKDYKATNERLTNNKNYAQFVIKEQRRAEKEDTDMGSFDAQIDDEDLMTGIISHT